MPPRAPAASPDPAAPPDAQLCGHLTLRRGDFRLDTGAFALPAHGITVLFGRSGCGKSTLLRAIAGLDSATRGQLRFCGQRWQDGAWALPTPQRDIGFVFQDAALFAHLSVRGNLLFAARRVPKAMAGAAQNAIDYIAAVADRTGVTSLLDQSVSTLSGGQRQRVAIARALLSRPRLLCMDEPLSALDWRAKAELLALIDALARETALPVLYITHSPAEVERLADRVVFMADGRITRIEPLQAALARPDSPLFEDEGPVSVLHGALLAPDADGLRPFVHGTLRLRLSPGTPADASARRLRVLARDVSIATRPPQGLSILNQLPATVSALHPDGAGRVTVTCTLDDGQPLLAQITAHSCQTLALQPGQAVWALVKSVALLD
ncbi:MAG: hypothetical protein OHK0048_14030 [Rhodoferax sp.]